MLISEYRYFLNCLLFFVAGKLRSHPVGSTAFVDEARQRGDLARLS
jgi:hypothetical protein